MKESVSMTEGGAEGEGKREADSGSAGSPKRG